MMPGNFRRSVLGLALLPVLVAAQTPANDLRTDSSGPIVVTGQRLTRQQARERAVTFVRQIGMARGDVAAARFVDPVCPVVRGIAEPYAGMVVSRMRAIAAAAGIRFGRQGCQPNVAVAFVGNGAGVTREINRRGPRHLEEVPHNEREAMLNGDAPIRWWYRTETRTRHQTRPFPGTVGSVSAEQLNHYDGGSHVSTAVNRAIVEAGVVIDLDGVEGRTLQAVATFAAFVAFAEVRPSDPPPAGSILGMFGAEPRASALTDWDLAFLQAVYQMPLDRQARRHRGMLVREMVEFQTRG